MNDITPKTLLEEKVIECIKKQVVKPGWNVQEFKDDVLKAVCEHFNIAGI